jgi:arylsulfatase A-like enzyme
MSIREGLFCPLVPLVALLWAVVAADSTSALAEGPPNIIYINVDDLGWSDLGFQGSEYYETPHLDRLASEGMVFTNAYAAAANCAPSRACCLTGQYSPRHGIYTVGSSERGRSRHRKLIPTKNTLFIENDNSTVAAVLSKAGYRTCTIGKWHISDNPIHNGFAENVAGCRWGHPAHGYFSPYQNPALEDGPKGEYLTDRLTDEAIEFIRRCRGDRFFLYLPFYTVHSPLQAKKEIQRHFSEKPSTDAHRNAAYAAMISSMDQNVGRLLEALQQLDLTERTFLLFSSDNGGVWQFSKQWPLRAGKGSYYEGGIRVPLVVRWPKMVQPGSRCDTPVSGIDFFPTLLQVAGVAKPAGKLLDGVSLTPLLMNSNVWEERPLFWHFPVYLQGGNQETRDVRFRTRPGSVVRLGDWKLHEYFEDGGLELYNLVKDIGEKNNLANQEPEKTAELLKLLRGWRDDVGAPVPKQLNPNYVP